MSSLQTIAPAKINFFLHVLRRRLDGYHELDSLVAFAQYGDKIMLEETKKQNQDTLSLSGEFSEILTAETGNKINSVLMAARLWREEMQKHQQKLPFLHFSLEKKLPVAAGIGGGSSDSSATLNLLAKHYPLNDLTKETFSELFLKLGADGPVTQNNLPKRMRGIGEILNGIPLFPQIGILLLNPGIKVSTSKIFQALDIPEQKDLSYPKIPKEGWKDARMLFSFLKKTRNDLEQPAIKLVPIIADILSQLRHLPACQLARMSGSGATCFALFQNKADAQNAEKILRSSPNTPKSWWIWSGETYPSKTTETKDF
ncbi:4-(cytidine 5'-diphospho)-2-C-methyl-D-erythritol kinase [Acetobacteraceae bacterium]|nr:4-(cytidine 5'-diphospho)-2-C-methyl-D-erythritol kinase [Acetobacteraceae bacterium]